MVTSSVVLRCRDGAASLRPRRQSDANEQIVGLSSECIAADFREQFILSGYRRPNISAKECVRSALTLECNETVNVWSHFLAFVYFAIDFSWSCARDYSCVDAYVWPLITFALGICGFCLMSTIAHMFNSLSLRARHACFYLDYATISVYSVGAGNAFFFYSRPLSSTWTYPGAALHFMIVSQAASVAATTLCCLSRSRWQRYKYVIRTMAFVVPFFVNASPYLYRLVESYNAPYDQQLKHSWMWFASHCVFYALSALANMTRFPERLFPGKFDRFGTSHNFLHAFTAVGSAHQFKAVHTDMSERKLYLIADASQSYSTYVLSSMAAAVVLNYSIAYYFIKTRKVQHHLSKLD